MTTAQFSRKTGLTLRRLQFWAEMGYLKADLITGHGGQGEVRDYKPEQIVRARRLKQLTASGIGVARAVSLVDLPWEKVLRIEVPTIVEGVLVIPDNKS